MNKMQTEVPRTPVSDSPRAITALAWLPLALLLSVTACGDRQSQSAQSEVGVVQQKQQWKQRLTEHFDDRAAVQAFYQQRNYEPFWVRPDAAPLLGDRATSKEKELLALLSDSDRHGLGGKHYKMEQIRALQMLDDPDLDARISMEVMLMQAYLRHAQHLAVGPVTPDEVELWQLPAPTFSDEAQLTRLQEDGVDASLAYWVPDTKEYQDLQQAREQLQQAMQDGGWPTPVFDGLVKAGEHHEAIPALRERLVAEGDMDPMRIHEHAKAEPTLYDPLTEAAFKRFQARHGLKVDGIIGPSSAQQLGMSAEARLAQVDVNLMRQRWLPKERAEDRIEVNVAAFELIGYENGREAIRMPVVVGDEQNPTPAFTDHLEYAEVNPYWTVPNSIIVKEIAPKMLENPYHLQEKNMIVQADWPWESEQLDPQTIDWAEYADPDATFPYVIRQLPGPGNALGQIKFMFPNEHAIYLHDTPQGHLFAEADRSFSHGCIRVAYPLKLAEFVLNDTDDWDRTRVEGLLGNGERTPIHLSEADRIPVLIHYQTVWRGEDGELNWRPDIYEQDKALSVALQEMQTPPEAVAAAAGL